MSSSRRSPRSAGKEQNVQKNTIGNGSTRSLSTRHIIPLLIVTGTSLLLRALWSLPRKGYYLALRQLHKDLTGRHSPKSTNEWSSSTRYVMLYPTDGLLTYGASECGRIPTSAELKKAAEILQQTSLRTQSTLPNVTGESLKRGLTEEKADRPSHFAQELS